MTYFKKLVFMIKLENRPIQTKLVWVFSWILLPNMFEEEYNTEYTFKKNMETRWK